MKKTRSRLDIELEYERGKPSGLGRGHWVNRGATYPYSSVRQDERNRRRYTAKPKAKAAAA